MSSVLFERIIDRVRRLDMKPSISMSGFGILEKYRESVLLFLKEFQA